MRVVWVGANDLSGQGSGGAAYGRAVWRLLQDARPDWTLETLAPGRGERPAGPGTHRRRQAASLVRSLAGGPPGRVRFSSYASLAARARAAADRGRPDLVVLDGPDVAAAARPLLDTGSPALLVVHNIEHRLFAGSLEREAAPVRLLMRLLGEPGRYARFERQVWERAAGFVHVSADEMAEMPVDRPAAFVPPLFEGAAPPARPRPPGPLRVGYLGKLTWWPNRAGLDWLLQQVWPGVPRGADGPELHVWGLGSEGYDGRAPGVHGHGFAPDLEDVWAASDVMVVPAVAGGGVNVKLCEALHRGKPVVATPLALRGLPLPDDPAIAVAETPEAMAAALDPAALAALARRAPGAGTRALFRPETALPRLDACLTALELGRAGG